MSSGLLEVVGEIDVTQFWPGGQSDADTAKVAVDVNADDIRFRKNESSAFHPTHVFDDAIVKGRERKPPIKNGKFTIRLQGIDAPELHYQPASLSRDEKEGATESELEAFKALVHFYRQLLGASAANALHEFLSETGTTTLTCRVFTQVDKPNEVFDTYARMVADIEIRKGGDAVNLNQWLVANGWAFPAFYTSMTDLEIETLRSLAKSARDEQKGVWPFLAHEIGAFNFDLKEPKKGQTSVLAHDAGPVLFPKLYRRQTNWSARIKAEITDLSFHDYLSAGSNGRKDVCFETEDFLQNGVHSAMSRNFADFVSAGNQVEFEPDGLVFSEAPSTLLARDGREIREF